MSYGWLTESSFHPKKQQEIQLDKCSINQAKVYLLEEKEKMKQKSMDNYGNSSFIPIQKSSVKSSISLKPTKEIEIYNNKMSVKQRIYEKLSMNTELTNEEKEFKKKSLINFDSKSNQMDDNISNRNDSNIINFLLSNQYDDLFIFNDVVNDLNKDNNAPITSYLKLTTQREKNRYDRLKRIQKIKSKL